MKKRVIILVLLMGLLLLGGMYFFLGESVETTPEIRGESGSAPLFLYTNYLDLMDAGTGPGDQLPPLTLTNSQGEEVSLFSSGKKVLLTYGTIGCEICHQMYPILEDWAQRYQDQLEVLVVFRGPAPEGEIQPLVAAGIQVIPDEEQVKAVIDPGNTYENLLIDEGGQVVDRFSFVVGQWQQYEKTLADWMETGRFGQEVASTVTVGKVPQVQEFTDALGQSFDLKKWQGQPLLLFLVSPDTIISQFTYPLAAKMKEKYGAEVELAVLFDYSDLGQAERIREYYQRYGLKGDSATGASPATPEKLREQTGITQVPVYFDQTGEFFQASRAQVLPALMVLDQESRLVGMYGFTTSDCCGFIGEKAEVMIDQVLAGME